MTLWIVSKCPEGALFKIWLNSVELKASRTHSKMDDIAGVLEDAGHSGLGLVSLVTLWVVYKCPEGVMFKIWLKLDEFEGIKNPVEDY